MPKTDQSLILPGIIGLASIFFGAGLALGGNWSNRPYEQSGKPYASVYRYMAKAVDANFAAYPQVESNKCYNAKDHDVADLCAQWRAAIAGEKAASSASWSNWLAFIGAIASIIGLIALLRSLKQTEHALEAAGEANKIAVQAAENQTRAWLEVDFTLNMKGQAFRGDLIRGIVSLRNHGPSPALGVTFRICITTHEKLSAMIENRVTDFVSGEVNWSDYIVFPNSVMVENASYIDHTTIISRQSYAVLIVAVYHTVSSETKRITARAWAVHDGRRDDYSIDPNDPPELDNISISNLLGYSGYAT
jgi:hypothetical protein